MSGDALQSEPAIALADELNIAPLGVGAWAWGTTRLWGYGKEYDRSDVGGEGLPGEHGRGGHPRGHGRDVRQRRLGEDHRRDITRG